MESIFFLLNMTTALGSSHLESSPYFSNANSRYSSMSSSSSYYSSSSSSHSGLSSASLRSSSPFHLPRKVARFVVVAEGQYDHEHHTHHGEQNHIPAPHFTSSNTTTKVFLGGTATLDCMVHDLTNESVSWLRQFDDKLELLTWGSHTYSKDKRYSLVQENGKHWQRWQLVIRNVQLSDRGQYRCQVATQFPMVLTTILNVTEPRVRVVDERGTKVEDKHYNSGSMIELKCVIEFVPFPHGPVTWRRGLKTLSFNTSIGGISVKGNAATGYIRSRLYVANASPRDSGVYSCWYSNYSSDNVTVHVIAGENSAGLQHDGHPDQQQTSGVSGVGHQHHTLLRYRHLRPEIYQQKKVMIRFSSPFGLFSLWTEGCLHLAIVTWVIIWDILINRWGVSLLLCTVHLAAHRGTSAASSSSSSIAKSSSSSCLSSVTSLRR